jgi:PAS domain S-box-containing protein
MAIKPTYGELEQSLKELERIFDFSIDIIGSGNLDGYFTKINSSFRQLLGYTEEELLEKPFISFIHDEDVEKTKEALAEAVKGKKYIHINNRYNCKDGSYKWIEWKVLSIAQENKFIAVGRDITDRKHTDEALKTSAENYRAIFESVNDAIMIHDAKTGRPLDINPKMVELLGYSKDELTKMRVEDWSADDPTFMQKEALRAIKKAALGEPQLFEWPIKRKDSKPIWVEVNLKSAVINGQKRVIAVVRDITERKKTENALRRSEIKYKALIKNIPGMVYSAYPDWSAEIISGCEAISGYTTVELNAKERNWLGIVHPDDLKRVSKLGSEIIKSSKEIIQTYRIITKSGNVKWVEDRKNSLVSKEGEFIGIDGIVFDISDRKVAEEALRSSEENYRGIFENSLVGFFQSTPEGQFISANQALASMLGYATPEHLIFSSTDIARQHYADPEERRRYHRLLEESGHIKNYEFEALREDGSHIWVSVSTRAYFDQDGKINRYEGVTIDITKRKLAEEAMRENEARFRTLIESTPDGIVISDAVGMINMWNNGARKMFGYTADEILGKPVSMLMPEVYHQRHRDGMRQMAVTGESKLIGSTLEVEGLRKDGSVFPLELSFSSWQLKKNRFFAAITRDITKRKEIENRLQQSLKLESIGNLAGGIAHDFNNILSSILGYTELALEDVEKGTLLEDNLQNVFTAGLRARDLVKQILTFARQADVELKPIQVSAIAKDALKLLRSTIPTSIEIRQNINSNSLIMGDPSQVHQIFMNLCTNAAHSLNARGGSLEVSISDTHTDRNFTDGRVILKPGDYLKITVTDTGTGISPEVIDSIFEPYFTTKKPGEGTGMGLASVHGIVNGLGGEIQVESEVGKGTIFTVYLPVTKKRDITTTVVTETLPTGNERILLIDDEPSIVNMTRQILESLGFKVITRTSSVEALELFKNRPNDFDLVITDMTMPNMTGDELAVKIIKIRPEIPIILCTGYSKKISDDSALELGIKAFVYKPIIKADLAKTVRNVLDEAKNSPQE